MWDFNVALTILSNDAPSEDEKIKVLDASRPAEPLGKAHSLMSEGTDCVLQRSQLANPDYRVSIHPLGSGDLLETCAECYAGIQNGDSPRFQRFFWEVPERDNLWVFQQGTVERTIDYGGREKIIYFDEERGHLRESAHVRRIKLHDSDQRGNQAWGKQGVSVSRSLRVIQAAMRHRASSMISLI
jgi:hypothetical protein